MRGIKGKQRSDYPVGRPKHWKISLLLAITVLSYTSALNCGYIWDDDSYVTENRNLTSVDGLVRIWTQPLASPQYYPLVFTTFWLERQGWGLNPFGYHLVNVLLHACVAGLLYYLLLCLEIPGAWLAALVFAVHPVNVETTAWITERKNLLSGFFYMLSAIALFRFYGVGRQPLSREAGSWSGHQKPRRKKNQSQGKRGFPSDFDSKGVDECAETPAVSSFLLRVLPARLTSVSTIVWAGPCALLSKTVTCTLPVALLIVLWWKRGRIATWDALSLMPLFAVGAAMGLVTAWLERTHVGARGADWDLGFGYRVLVAGRALCFYAWKLLWPVNLSFNYEHWMIDGTIWWQYLYPLAAASVFIALWMAHGRIGRGPVAAALFFGASLFPALASSMFSPSAILMWPTIFNISPASAP